MSDPLSVKTPFRKSAKVSIDGLFRTRLDRQSDFAGTMTFIMLNPSTADAAIDDPTIRRCLGFMVREGLGSLRVVNLFTLRTSKPRVLWAEKTEDPLGPDAKFEIENAISDSLPEQYVLETRRDAEPGSGWDELPFDRIVCAWGAMPTQAPEWFLHMRAEQIENVVEYARALKRELFCIGRTESGHPRHPLYVRKDEPLVRFEP